MLREKNSPTWNFISSELILQNCEETVFLTQTKTEVTPHQQICPVQNVKVFQAEIK